MQRLFSYFTFLLLLLMYNLSFTQDNAELVKVTDQLYFISGLGGNVSFLVTDDGILVVDSGTRPEHAKKIENFISGVTSKPIKYLVLTHYHQDHTAGAGEFGKDVTIIGQENIKNNLSKNPRASKDVKVVTPALTFNAEMNIYLGKDTVTLKFPGNTHTNCNIIVEFKNQNAVATGDMFFYHIMPYIDYNAKSNTKNWIEQLKLLSAKNYKYIIPGHGKLASSEDLLSGAEYLTDLRAAVQSFISKNKTLEETLKELKMDKYSDFGFHQALPIEVEAVYKELKGM